VCHATQLIHQAPLALALLTPVQTYWKNAAHYCAKDIHYTLLLAPLLVSADRCVRRQHCVFSSELYIYVQQESEGIYESRTVSAE
jgi:hypothetical protein